jgi:hypothetical protein
MAEVRQIPSAVGAFEAQVFDMGKTYRTIMTQAAAQRKAQSDQKKELDKMMVNAYAAKGKGRLQDMPELEKQYNELQNYYINNGSAIMAGGKEFLEFQKKRSEFIFEADAANLRKERDKQLSPFFKLKIDKEGLSQESENLMRIFNLPYNHPERKNFTYKGSDGLDHGIDELNVTDIDKYTKFNEIDLMKDIETTVKAKKVTDLKVEPSGKWGVGGGFPILVTGTTELKDPIEIAQAVTGTLSSKPDAVRYYKEMFNKETSSSLQNASYDMDMLNSIYRGAGFSQFVNFDNDGNAGITNEVEYAIYRNLKSNLPQDLGDKISTQLANLQISARGLGLRFRKFEQELQDQPIDAKMISDIESGRFNPRTWSDVSNNMGGAVDPSLTDILPWAGQIRSNKTATVLVRKPLRKAVVGQGESEFITDPDEASRYGITERGRNQNVFKDEKSGVYYLQEKKEYDFNPSTNQTWKADAARYWQDMKQAQFNQDNKVFIDRYLKQRTTETTVEGAMRR